MKPKKAVKPPVTPPKKKGNAVPADPQRTWFFLKPQNIFLILATVFGLCFVFVIPPFQVPDEASHMFRAYQLSTLHVKVQEQNNVFGNYMPPAPDNKVVGTYLPASLDSVHMQFFYLKFRPQNKIKKKTIVDLCSVKLEPDKEKFTEMTGWYSYFNYIPQIPAILLARMINLNVLPLFYLGRLFALAFFILCVWYSIKIVPFGKNIFLVLALIPMVLVQAGSYSPDSVINAFSFLALALLLHLITQKSINLKDKKLIMLISILCLFGVLKQVYFPWVFMILLIPRKLFEKPKEYYLTLFITFFVSTISALLWTYLIFHNQEHNPDIVAKELIETPSHQMHIILNDPLIVFDIFRETLAAKSEFYYKSLIGILGYLDTLLPGWIYTYSFLILLIVAVLDFNKSYQFTVYQRVLIFVFSLGIFFATIFAMYIIDGIESKATLVAEGVQGRYFIPALVIFCFGFYGIIRFDTPLFERYKIIYLILFAVCFSMLYQTQHTLYLRYFVEGADYFKYISS